MQKLTARLWRMLTVRWQAEPLSGAGAAAFGGRWNRVGQPALYLSFDHATAIAEFHQSLVRPGTLAAYDVQAAVIADLSGPLAPTQYGFTPDVLRCQWRHLHRIKEQDPPSWSLTDRLIAGGAQGAVVPSVQHRGGLNLVLWNWSGEGGKGAQVRVLDPHGELTVFGPN
jgi:RES domain-containing protein